MTTEKIKKLKSKLEEEKKLLESELESVGKKNPDNAADWVATPGEIETSTADENELADRFEELEENTALVGPLETRYNEVKKALDKINSGKGYGICEVDGKPIEEDRLEANPAAATCKEHMK